jgi:hypothetical protein
MTLAAARRRKRAQQAAYLAAHRSPGSARRLTATSAVKLSTN